MDDIQIGAIPKKKQAKKSKSVGPNSWQRDSIFSSESNEALIELAS